MNKLMYIEMSICVKVHFMDCDRAYIHMNVVRVDLHLLECKMFIWIDLSMTQKYDSDLCSIEFVITS